MDSRIEIRPGRTIHLSTHNNPNSDAIAFLIHGLGGRGNQWREQIDFLKSKYTLVIPDLLGHGESEKPNSNLTNLYSFPELIQDVHAIFNRYSSANNVVLGHSYGGAFAASLALSHQDKIKKLILICPTPCVPSIATPYIYRSPAYLLELMRPLLENQFRHLAFSPGADPNLLKIELQAAKANPMYLIKSLIYGMKLIPKTDIRLLKTPTLIITGNPDGLVPPMAQKEFYKKLPHHQFDIINPGSHMVLLEKPQQANQSIRKFLEYNE